MQDLDAPGATSVHVWVAPLSVAPPQRDALVACLDAAERARAKRYRDQDDADAFSVARGWLRHVLATATATPAAEIDIVGAPGKPRLGAGTLCFNLSRTAGLALIAVSAREVGVDVEHRDHGQRGLDAMTLACSPAEAAAIDALSPQDRAEAFLRRWTTKEAYLKARGIGLSLAPDRIGVGAAPAGAPAPVQVAGQPARPRWWVRELRLGPSYVAAVAAEGHDWTVVLRRATDLVP